MSIENKQFADFVSRSVAEAKAAFEDSEYAYTMGIETPDELEEDLSLVHAMQLIVEQLKSQVFVVEKQVKLLDEEHLKLKVLVENGSLSETELERVNEKLESISDNRNEARLVLIELQAELVKNIELMESQAEQLVEIDYKYNNRYQEELNPNNTQDNIQSKEYSLQQDKNQSYTPQSQVQAGIKNVDETTDPKNPLSAKEKREGKGGKPTKH